MILVRKAIHSDAEYIAKNLRKADRLEFYRVSGENNALGAIRYGLDAQYSVSYCFEVEGKPIALVGCIELSDYKLVWACGTDEIALYGKSFVMETKRLLASHKSKWKPYINYVDCENTNAVNYLRRVGFELLDPIPYGKLGEKFYPFIMG